MVASRAPLQRFNRRRARIASTPIDATVGQISLVAWTQYDGGLQNAYASQLTSGVWGVAELLEEADAADARGLYVAVDANGDATAVWTQLVCANGFQSTYANRLTSGTWGGAELVKAFGGGHVFPTGVGMDDDGNAVTTLMANASGQYHLFGARLTPSP